MGRDRLFTPDRNLDIGLIARQRTSPTSTGAGRPRAMKRRADQLLIREAFRARSIVEVSAFANAYSGFREPDIVDVADGLFGWKAASPASEPVDFCIHDYILK